jgi:hypothetical protein
MKKINRIFCIFVFIIFSFVNINYLAASNRGLKLTVKTPKGNRIDLYRDSYALIVGNSNYSNGWEPIPGAIRDVNEVATALEKHGFTVSLKTDLTKEKFSRALNEFSLKYGRDKDNRLLFYYAGHGFTQQMATGEELGYLVMVNAPLPEADLIGFSLSSVDMQSLITQAKIIRARHVLFMFDSCFSGSIINMRERVIPKSISDSVQYPVRQFITAGRANEPVPDQSVFKQAFLDLLEGRDSEPIPDHYITGEELGLYLKTKVPQYNPGQHPQYGKIKDPRLDKGDFVFVLKRPESIRQPDPQPSDLAAEKKRLADETAQIERERQELAQLKLELGKQKLEAESQRLEEEKLKLASIPKTVAVTRILLREKPIVITNQIHITNMLFKYDFFERYKNPRGSFENVFIDNNDGTITDRATGLMWQKSGSSKFLDNINIKEYIKRLNIQKLSGYSDWRMPTIEELASLLTRRRKNGVHIDPVFDNKQVRCWSVDQSDPIEPYYSVAWIISFEFGEVTQAIYIKKSKIQWGTGAQNKNAMNYIKAVRAVK